MTDNRLARNGEGVTPIPNVYTNQQLIDAFYYAAEALGIADYRQLLASGGLDLDALAAQRAAIYNGPAVDQLDGLSPEQRTVLQRELLGELLKQVRWTGLVNAPDGLNLRRSPSTQEPPLALLSHETLVQVLGESGDWLFVMAGGQPGYIFAAHVLRRIAPGPDEPSPGTPTTPADEDYAPPAEEQVAIPPGADSATRVVAEVWNHYGAALKQEAQRLQIDPTLAAALLAAESSGHGYGTDGRLLIRFENHIFYDQWGKSNQAQFFTYFRYDTSQRWRGHQWRADPTGEWQELHRDNQAYEWQAFAIARQLDETAALLSISMGMAQIMGFNYSMIGFGSVQDMFGAFQASIANQIAGFFRFVEAKRLVEAVRSGDLRAFAVGYNGAGQADTYAEILRSYTAALNQLRAPAAASLVQDVLGVPPVSIHPVSVPLPPSPVPGIPLAEADPELYAIWRKHIQQGLANNQLMFERVLHAFMGPYWTTVWTYRVLIAIGVGGFLTAAVLGFRDAEWPVTAIFGGLSIVSFLTFFLSRPLQALEENLQFITWLGVVYNTYWTRLVNAQNADTFQADLAGATNEFVQQLHQLVNVHGERSDKRQKIN